MLSKLKLLIFIFIFFTFEIVLDKKIKTKEC